MKVYQHNDATYARVHVTPAGDRDFHSPKQYDGAAFPSEWMTASGDPITFVVEFVNGEAVTQDSIAKYMIERNLAHKTKFRRQIRRLFDALGNVVEVPAHA